MNKDKKPVDESRKRRGWCGKHMGTSSELYKSFNPEACGDDCLNVLK